MRKPEFVVCGVDNQLPQTRLEVCRWCVKEGVAAVFLAVTPDADAGYVLVQKPKEACWECVQKSALAHASASAPRSVRCPGTPASIDILMLVSGYALYAIDSLLMARPRAWNYIYLSLSRPQLNRSCIAVRRGDCVVCGNSRAQPA